MSDCPADATPPAAPPKRRLKLVRIATFVAVSLALIASLLFREHLRELRRYGYVAVFVVGLVSNATLILPVPGLAVSSVLGSVFNPWAVGLVAGLGQALGELTGYLAGYGGQTWVDENARYRRLTAWMERHGVLVIFLLALLPNPLFDVAGLIAGALRYPVWKFLLACMGGKVVKNILFAVAGDYGLGVLFGLPGGD